MENRTRGFLLILFASLCLSTLPELLTPRMVIGAALLWLWIGTTRPQRVRIDRAGLQACAVAGIINAVTLLLFYLGLRRVGASVAILVFSTYPALLLLLLHLRGESVTRRDLLRLALALAGIALVAEPGAGAVDLVSYPASTSALWIVTFLALGAVLMRPLAEPAPPLDFIGWGVVLWSGIIGTAVARVATVAGVRLLGGGQTALLLPAETVMTLVWAALLLGERISAQQTVGAALVLTSVLLATVFRRRPLSPLAQ